MPTAPPVAGFAMLVPTQMESSEVDALFALVLAFFAFALPMAVPLFAQRWRSLGLVILAGVLFFAWLTLEMETEGTLPHGVGPFLGGLMLFGFAGGTIARFVSLLGRKAPDSEAADEPAS